MFYLIKIIREHNMYNNNLGYLPGIGGGGGGGGGGTGSVALPNYVRVTPTGGFSDKDPYNTIDNALTAISSGTIALSGGNHIFPTKSLNNIVLSGLDEGTIVTTNNLLINNGDTVVFNNLKFIGNSTLPTPILILNKTNIKLKFNNCIFEGFNNAECILINNINGSIVNFNNCEFYTQLKITGTASTSSVINLNNCFGEEDKLLDLNYVVDSNTPFTVKCISSGINILKQTGGNLQIIDCQFKADTELDTISANNATNNSLTITNGTTFNYVLNDYTKIYKSGSCQCIITNCDTNHNNNIYFSNTWIQGNNNRTRATVGNSNITTIDKYIDVDCTSQNITQTLFVGEKKYHNYIVYIKKTDGTKNKLIVTTQSNQKMLNPDDGSTTAFSIVTQNQYVAFKFNWDVSNLNNIYWERMI